MMEQREVLVVATADETARQAAERFVAFAVEAGLADDQGGSMREVHVAVSGGSVATAVLPAIVEAADRRGIDWSRVHVWFADERFVPRGNEERNAATVAAVLRGARGFVPTHLHPTLSSDLGLSLDEAATAYERELRVHVPPRSREPGALPSLDLVLLGAGPDGHTASLFPGRDDATPEGRIVIPVIDSPKPPPERVSLTFDAIGAAGRVWTIVTGAGKAEAATRAYTAAPDRDGCPVGAVFGIDETVVFLDADAASGLARD